MARRLYEGLFLFDSALAAKDAERPEQVLRELFAKHGVEVESLQKWDDRRLAYEIDHVKRGTYYLGVLRIEPQAVQGLRRDLEYSTEVLRYLLLQDDKLLERIEERKLLAEKRAKEQAHTGRRGAGAGRGERARRR